MNPIEELASNIQQKLREELLRQGHVARGDLMDKTAVRCDKTATGIEVVGRSVYYAKWVDYGRKKHQKGIPLDVLMDWIRVKKINLGGMNLRSKAFQIQQSIKKNGIKRADKIHFIQRTLSSQQRAMDAGAKALCLEIMTDEIELFVKEIANWNDNTR